MIRLLGSDDFPAESKRQAVEDLSAAAAADAIRVPEVRVLDLEDIAEAHDLVGSPGSGGRVLLAIP